MGLPVVTVAAGGLPVVESTVGGTPVTEATNGYGVPVTKVTGGKPGLPVVFETIGVGGGGTTSGFAGSAMLGGGLFPVVVTGTPGVRQGNIGGVQVGVAMASYYVWSGATGTATGADWANAKTTLAAAFVTEVAGDTIFVAHDHAESTATTVTLTSSGTSILPTKVVCVNRTGSVPPVSADRRATAQVSCTGASNNMNFAGGGVHFDGIIFKAGDVANNALIVVGTITNTWFRFDNCSLRLNNTAASSSITFGGSSGNLAGMYTELNNTTLSFGAVGQIATIVGTLKWRNTPSALLGTIPTSLIGPYAGAARGGVLECIGVDFSAAGAGKTIFFTNSAQSFVARFIDCKFDAAVTRTAVPHNHGDFEIDFVRCGATGVNYAVYRSCFSGLLTEETTIVRTGGATG